MEPSLDLIKKRLNRSAALKLRVTEAHRTVGGEVESGDAGGGLGEDEAVIG